MLEKNFYRISEIRTNINDLFEKGMSKGLSTGFEALNDLYTLKLGATTYIGSAPASGKTEFTLELQMNYSEKYGFKHVIFSPETGTKEEIAAELISKYCRKAFYRNYKNVMTEQEMFNAQAWVDEHFFIVDSEAELTIEGFYELIDTLEQTFGVTIQMTLADPFNEFKHDFSKDEGRQDLYIERVLGLCRRNAKQKNRHNIIVTHCRDQQIIHDKGSDIWYYPAPTARDFAGGQAWFRKGMAMIVIYRPPEGMADNEGIPYQKNEVHILVRKAKPKGIGRPGKAVLYFDIESNRYYEYVNGAAKYAWGLDCQGREEKILTPISKLVTRQEKIDLDKEEAPF